MLFLLHLTSLTGPPSSHARQVGCPPRAVRQKPRAGRYGLLRPCFNPPLAGSIGARRRCYGLKQTSYTSPGSQMSMENSRNDKSQRKVTDEYGEFAE
jgi:hypothetical protein